tara:strand:- start:8057 stop:9079 length:1023 start_codon:yes stop_codon:yes gene_type:complete
MPIQQLVGGVENLFKKPDKKRTSTQGTSYDPWVTDATKDISSQWQGLLGSTPTFQKTDQYGRKFDVTGQDMVGEDTEFQLAQKAGLRDMMGNFQGPGGNFQQASNTFRDASQFSGPQIGPQSWLSGPGLQKYMQPTQQWRDELDERDLEKALAIGKRNLNLGAGNVESSGWSNRPGFENSRPGGALLGELTANIIDDSLRRKSARDDNLTNLAMRMKGDDLGFARSGDIQNRQFGLQDLGQRMAGASYLQNTGPQMNFLSGLGNVGQYDRSQYQSGMQFDKGLFDQMNQMKRQDLANYGNFLAQMPKNTTGFSEQKGKGKSVGEQAIGAGLALAGIPGIV